MTIARWKPTQTVTRQEKILLKRGGRVRKLFAFLREHRHELFDDDFQAELETMYRTSGAGKEANPPALMAMATLLQGYVGASDAEAVELTVVDLRWQMVLGVLGSIEPAFSQGALQAFRQRLIEHDMDRRLLEHTRDVAIATGAFDAKKLPKELRVAMDSSPLEGAGRVEDTFNLLGHAARNIVAGVATVTGLEVQQVCEEAGIGVLLHPSIKAGLDCEWSDPVQKQRALRVLIDQIGSLRSWIEQILPEEVVSEGVQRQLDVLDDVVEQNIELAPNDDTVRVAHGVAPDRQISIVDGEMRHGRKTKSKRFNGYKRHISADLDTDLIIACAMTPANEPEEKAAPLMKNDIERQGLQIAELHIDRGYINSSVVDDVLGTNGDVVCKAWVPRNSNKGKFTKADFRLNLRELTITCPAEVTESFRTGEVVKFDPERCDQCSLRKDCTTAAPGRARTVNIARDEQLQQRLRKRIATRRGRENLRRRVAVEHRLAHIAQRQGRRARYIGIRNNLFDLRRASTIQNLETVQRVCALQAA